MKYQTPSMPWEKDHSLVRTLRHLRGKGIFAFSARHLNSPELIEAQHEQHLKNITKRARQHEQQENKKG